MAESRSTAGFNARSERDIGGPQAGKHHATLPTLSPLEFTPHRGKRVRNDDTDPLITLMRLAGITKVEDGYLRVRNLVYARVFDERWIRENMPDGELRRQKQAYSQGMLRATTIGVAIDAGAGGIFLSGVAGLMFCGPFLLVTAAAWGICAYFRRAGGGLRNPMLTRAIRNERPVQRVDCMSWSARSRAPVWTQTVTVRLCRPR